MTSIYTPARSPFSRHAGDSSYDGTFRIVAWYLFAVPTVVCLLASLGVILVLDVMHTPSSGPCTSLRKVILQYQNWYELADISYNVPSCGHPPKRAPVFAPARITVEDILSSDEHKNLKEAADVSMPVTMASASAENITSAEASGKRSASMLASTLVNETPKLTVDSGPAADINPSQISSHGKEPRRVTEREVQKILTTEGKLFRKVLKKGMLPKEKWIPPKDHKTIRFPLNKWPWDHSLGYENGESPPKAATCTLLFNPLYKFILINNTKIAGTSLFLKFGGHCPDGVTLESAKENPNCLWRVTDIMRIGLNKLGFGSFEELWEDYTVIAPVHNPYDRAVSSYDYTLGRRKDRSGLCADPSFKQFTSKPHVIGLQDTLFKCGDTVHGFYAVEPQHTCLLDDKSNLVVDWLLRVNSLEQDLKPALYEVNRKRDCEVPRLKGGGGWERRGPLADNHPSDGVEAFEGTRKSRHALKFVECGAECFQNVNSYYRKDFELLQYTMEDFED